MTCYSCYKYLLLHLKRFVYRCFLIATIGNVYLKNGLFSYLQEEAEKLRIILSMASFMSLTTWKWSNTCTATGACSITEAIKALDTVVFHLQPKSPEGVSSLSVAHMNNPACIQVNDYCLVYMSLADGKFVNADVPHTPYVRIPVSGFQSSFMNVLYRIPSQMKIFCHVNFFRKRNTVLFQCYIVTLRYCDFAPSYRKLLILYI